MTITGTPDSDILHGTAEEDIILAGAGDDIIYVDSGEEEGAEIPDEIHAGRGDDVIRGFIFDVADLSDAAAGWASAAVAPTTVIDGGAGQDVLRIKFVNSNANHLSIPIFFSDVSVKNIESSVYSLAWKSLAPSVTGSSLAEYFDYKTDLSANLLKAGGGADVIRIGGSSGSYLGGGGNDVLIANYAPSSSIKGGGGADTFVFVANPAAHSEDEAKTTSYADFRPGSDRMVLITESVTIANTKDLTEAPAMLANLAYSSNAVFNRFVDYNSATGDLSYHGKYVTTLDTGLTLDHRDFLFA